MTRPFIKKLTTAASAPYHAEGRFAWHFARSKLSGDPVFAGLLEHGLIPDNTCFLDIGCGQGLLASWLRCAAAFHQQGDWPAHWPAAPRLLSIHGIEIVPRDVQRARRALGDAATFTQGDMCTAPFGKSDVIVILDVLHYVSIAAQDDVLQRAREALAPNGTLLLRVGDAAAGLPFKVSFWVDYAVCVMRGQRNPRMYCRPLTAWCAALADLGFSVRTLQMRQGTPFANVLLVAKLGHNSDRHAT